MFWTIGLIPGRRQVNIFTPAGLPLVAIPRKSQAFRGDGTGRREVAACEPWIGSAEGNGGKMMKNDIRVAERNDGCGDFTGNHFLRLFVRNGWKVGWRIRRTLRCCATSASGQGAALPWQSGQGCARLRSGQNPVASLLAFWVQIILLAI